MSTAGGGIAADGVGVVVITIILIQNMEVKAICFVVLVMYGQPAFDTLGQVSRDVNEQEHIESFFLTLLVM
jgi:hypothetical protein